MTDCRNIYELLPHLALGDLTQEERKAVEDHLVICAHCRNEYAKISSLLEDLQQSLQTVPIPKPLAPKKICQAFLPSEDSHQNEWMDTPPALWRDVMVALDSVDAPSELSPERMENIFECVKENKLRKRFTIRRRRISIAATVAASILILLSLFLTDIKVSRKPANTESALCVVHADKAWGLDIPESLPGTIRLARGEATIQLNSGVTLALLGPAELNVKNGMFVRLYSGRLLADVPSQAAGFTVRTPELEAYDLGTIFSISAQNGISDVFVFKGSVQINESGEWGTGTPLSEAGMSICKAGEGVYKKRGETPVRFVADNRESREIFKKVKGVEALQNPVAALQAARKIADSWINRYMPDSNLAFNASPSCSTPPITTDNTYSYASPKKTRHFRSCSQNSTALTFVGPQVPNMYYSEENVGYSSWGKVGNWCFYQSCGGGFVGRLPNSNDTVRINAATLAVEEGCALNIGTDINAECYNFASGYMNYPGTACLRMTGGSLTSHTTTVIGMYYPGLAVLESGSLYTETDFLIGGYGNPDGHGVVTNNGANISTLRLHLGHESGTFGKLVHNSGYLDCRAADPMSSLQVGFNGGAGEFEASAGFSVNTMGIGLNDSGTSLPGTGTVTLAEGSVGVINNTLRIGNGSLFMKGGTVHLQNTTGVLTNLYVCPESNSKAEIRGWGTFSCTNLDKILRMINNGMIVADGEGVNRDLDFSLIAVINSQNNSSGWDAINKGRVLFPRTYQAFSAGKSYCLGDLYRKATPSLVNSLSFSFSSPVKCIVRGGFCASDRKDIPAGLPGGLRPLGIWCLGAYSNKVFFNQESFSDISLTFRYDQTKLKSPESKLLLYRYNGSTWTKVGECIPDGSNLISTETSLAPVSSGDYNIGWFALMDVSKNGTVIFVF